jgi:PAS domain S-box-containing protein
MHRIARDARRYLLAILAAVFALFLRKLLDPLLGTDNPYHTMWLAIVFSAWYCGLGPSLTALAIGLLGIWYWFLPPYNSFAPMNHTDFLGLLSFAAFSGVIMFLGESNRHIIDRREQVEEELRKAQQGLERRVKDRTAELEHKVSEIAEKAALLDLANDAIFVKAATGTITYWNQGAERLYGWTKGEALGRSPHELLRTEFPIPLTEIEAKDYWEGELRHTKRDGVQIVVASRWTTMRDKEGKPAAWLEINTDVTARKRAEEAARSLSGRLLTLQDDERRRIATGLHDSLGQFLTALKINLHLLSTAEETRAKVVSECYEIVDQCLTETRTISHLLHPPLLDEAGFGSAAQWYVDGFADRSGIKVKLDLPPKLGRLHRDVETALFRAVQEALTNVHRHSGSSAVDIRIDLDEEQVRLEIKDYGRGIPKERLNRLTDDARAGIGIAGMRERARELRGALEIKSDETGTRVIVAIPLLKRTSHDSGEPSQSISTT